MSWFSKVGDAFNWIKGTAAPAIGGALAAAQHAQDAADAIPGVGAIENAVNPIHALITNPIAAPVVSQGTGAINTAYSYGLARPLSTFTQQVESASQPGSSASLLFNTDDWRKAWNSSADVSPGQALVIGSGLAPKGLNYDMTPDEMQSREQFFHNTWQGQISSGTLDLALNLGADPTMLASKGIKGAALARNTFKDSAERDLALDVNAGNVAAPSARIGNLSGRMDKLFGQLDGKTSAEIALHPVVKEADKSGAFAYMFGRINEEFAADEAARRAAQRNVFGAMLGNSDSIQALKDQHALLANELQRLSDTPITSKAAGDFTWDDHGQGMLNIANQDVPPEIANQKDAIEQELARLETATSGTGTVNRLAGTVLEQHRYGNQLAGLRQSTLNTGLGNMPIRVIGGVLANRLPGHVSVKDVVSGSEDLRNTLAQSRWVPGVEQRQLLDNYHNAATDGDRQKAVYDAEGRIVQATAGQYGLTPQQARKLAEAGNGRRQAVLSSLSSRLYSAAPDDKFIPFVDPEEGEISAISRPILQSQIEDNVPIIDPRKLDAALKEATQNRMLERVAGQFGDDAKNVTTSAYNVAGSAQMIASDALGKLTRVWKDGALMRLAYPARVQIDSQMRLMTHMGTLSYLGAVGSGLKAEGKALLSTPGGDKLSLRNVFKDADYEKSVGDILRGAGHTEDEIPTITRLLASEDGGMADLAQHMTDAQLARYRATGEWGYVDQANPAWSQAWTRAVNRQIRNSPTAMRVAQGFSTGELKTFVQTNPAARREWLNLKSSNGDDMDGWLSRVQAHVDHYLPTAEMKNAVAGEAGRGEVPAIADRVIKGSPAVTEKVPIEGQSSWEGGPALFHGTSQRFAEDTPTPDPWGGSGARNLFGYGFYTTDAPNVAESYVKKGRGKEPQVYNVKWNGKGQPRVLDLATSHNKDVRDFITRTIERDDIDGDAEVYDKLKAMVADSSVPDEKLLHSLRGYLGQSGIPMSEADDIYGELAQTLGEKYDVLRHVGGKYVRSDGQEHGVHIFLDPEKIKTEPVPFGTREVSPATPDTVIKGREAIPASDGLPGNEVTQADVEKWFGGDRINQRMRVHGESFAPTTKSAAGAAYEATRNWWYKTAAEAPETTMARVPLYAYAFKRNLSDIVARHGDDAIDEATMTQYRRSASNLARREVGKILYDTSHSSNLSTTLRYVSPFFSAWEDMMKKWGGLFYDKPWAGVRFEQAWDAPNNAGLVVDENGNRVDADGNRFDPNTGRKLDPVKDKYLIGKRELVTVPAALLPKALKDAAGIGELDPATGKKRPATVFSIDKNSFNIVFQGDPWWLPGAGPIVQVPVNSMVQHGMIKNTDSPIVQALLPYGVSDSSLGDQILPSWARNARAAFMQNGQEYANTRAMLLAQETSRWENGERPTKPTGDEIDGMARNWFILKAITSDASPVSMQPTVKTQFYVDQAHIYKQKYARPQGMLNSYIQKYGLQDGKAKFDTDYPNWQSQYLKDFPQWYDMSLSMSDNQTGIVATDNAVDIARTPFVKAMVRDNPDYGWYFVGAANQYGNTPGSAFSQTAYAQQETMGLRGQAKPEDALAKVEASKGWMQYQTAMTQVNLILKDRGLHSVTQKGAEDLAAWKQQFEQALMKNNESWKKDFLSTDSGKISNFLDVAKQAMAANSTFAKQPQNVALGNYMEARGLVQQILKNRQVHSLSDPSNEDVSAVWDGIVSYLVNGNIGFEQIYNRLLQNDDPSKSIPGVATNGG